MRETWRGGRETDHRPQTRGTRVVIGGLAGKRHRAPLLYCTVLVMAGLAGYTRTVQYEESRRDGIEQVAPRRVIARLNATERTHSQNSTVPVPRLA